MIVSVKNNEIAEPILLVTEVSCLSHGSFLRMLSLVSYFKHSTVWKRANLIEFTVCMTNKLFRYNFFRGKSFQAKELPQRSIKIVSLFNFIYSSNKCLEKNYTLKFFFSIWHILNRDHSIQKDVISQSKFDHNVNKFPYTIKRPKNYFPSIYECDANFSMKKIHFYFWTIKPYIMGKLNRCFKNNFLFLTIQIFN